MLFFSFMSWLTATPKSWICLQFKLERSERSWEEIIIQVSLILIRSWNFNILFRSSLRRKNVSEPKFNQNFSNKKKMAGPTDSAQHFLHARHFNPKPFETQSKKKSTPDSDQLHTTQSYQRFQKMISVNMPGCTLKYLSNDMLITFFGYVVVNNSIMEDCFPNMKWHRK